MKAEGKEYRAMEAERSFKVGECKGQKEVDGQLIPLVLNPAAKPRSADAGELAQLLRKHKPWFEEALMKHSAVLVRGFDVGEAAEFDEVVEALGWDNIRYVGPAPRTHVHNRVWTANECALSEFIYFHHEMVLIKKFPSKVILFCEVAPPEGGETPIVPSWRVTERMLEEFPELVEEMEEKSLRYTFIATSSNDTSSIRGGGWEAAFGTTDRIIAEQRAKASGMDIEWQANGAAKTTLGPRELTQVFPGRKGRRMWWNTLVGMHDKESSSAEMANGTEIPASLVKRCEEIIEEESIQFKWEKGDILFLDNLAILHGRRPSLPPRRVLVAVCK